MPYDFNASSCLLVDWSEQDTRMYAQINDKDHVIYYADMFEKLCEKLPYEDVKTYCSNKVKIALMIIN